MVTIKPLEYMRLVAKEVLLKMAMDLVTAWLIVGVFFLAGVGIGLIGLHATHALSAWSRAGALALAAVYALAVAIVSSVRLAYCIKHDLRSQLLRTKSAKGSSSRQDKNAGTSSGN